MLSRTSFLCFYNLSSEAGAAGSSKAAATIAATSEVASVTASSTVATVAILIATVAIAVAVATDAASAEDVEAIGEGEHGVGGDAVAVGVGAGSGGDGAVDHVALLQDVVPAQGEGGLATCEEGVGCLCIPDPLVGVHGVLGVAATTLLVDVGAEVESEVKVHDGRGAIGEGVGVKVAGGGGCGARAVVGEGAAGVDFQGVVVLPGLAEGEAKSLRELVGVGDILHRGFITLVDVAVAGGMVEGRLGGDAEALVAQGSVEVERGASVPVAADVHGLGDARTGAVVVLGAAGGGVLGGAQVGVEVVGTLVVGLVEAPFGAEGVGEAGLQVGVTEPDIQGVGIAEGVGDEVGDGGLSALSAVACLHLMLSREAVAEVQRGRPVDDGTRDVVMLPAFIVVHAIDLRLKVEASVEAHLGVDEAVLEADVVVLVAVLGVVALGGVG